MIRLKLLPVFLVLSATLSGCAIGNRETVLYPIEKRDIQRMKTGAQYSPEVDGWFVSDLYLREVMAAKVEDIKKTS